MECKKCGFTGVSSMDYSKLLEKWVFYCRMCGRIHEPEGMPERLKRAIESRKRNGDHVNNQSNC